MSEPRKVKDMGKNIMSPNDNMRVEKSRPPLKRDERRELIDVVAIVPSFSSFFRVVEERGTVAAEGASGEKLILAESGEDFCASAAEGTSFKRQSHD